jgi:virginiamycin A acetyltransferase
MGKGIKASLKAVFYKMLSKLIPEIAILKDPGINWSLLKSSFLNSRIDKLSKIIQPYRISDTEIGKGTYIASNAVVSMTDIGNFCSIGPNFLSGWGIHPTDGLSTSPAFYSTLKQNGFTYSPSDKIEERRKITIGNDVFIGANVVVLDGVSIGDGAVIGAGAVVSKDIPPYAIAVGCPVTILKYRFPEDIREKLLKIQWWDFDETGLRDVEKYFYDIDAFIQIYSGKLAE